MSAPNKFLRDNLRVYAFKAALAAIALAAMAYEIARAIGVSFTIDEASTFLLYVRDGFLALFNFNEANNHFLNSALTKICYVAGGNHDLILRLPNLVGFVLYLVFGYLILERFTRRTTVLFGFILLVANAYVLDFFSLCRGYGLSLGFLMAALYLFLIFLSRYPKERARSASFLTGALACAIFPVFSNFALLNVYLSLVAVALFMIVVFNRRDQDRSPAAAIDFPRPRPHKKAYVLGIALIGVFNILVISQDVDLTPRIFKPVTVRLNGISTAAAAVVVVKGRDYKKREVPFIYGDGAWSIGPGSFLTGLHFMIPKAALAGVRDLEIRIGEETFRTRGEKLRAGAELGGRLTMDSRYHVSLARATLPLFEPAINWAGDANHAAQVGLRFLWLALIFAGGAAVLHGLERLLIRSGILRPGQWGWLVRPTLALGAIIAYPVFMLKESPEFVWGGRIGFIHDTLKSVIEGSYYGQSYFPGEIKAVALVALVAIAVFAAAVRVHVRRKSLSRLIPSAFCLVILTLVSFAVLLQRTFFNNPYPKGRTALFYIPLSILFLVFSCDALRDAGRAGRWIAFTFLAGAAVLAAYHFSRTANTAITEEWRWDADVDDIVTDIEHFKAERYASLPKLRLGVDGDVIMSLYYYVDQRSLGWLDVRDYDERPDNDLYLLRVPFDPARMVLIKRYPASGDILVQAKR